MVANPLTEHFNNLARWLSGGENCTKRTWTEQWLHMAMSLSKRPANSNSTTDTETRCRCDVSNKLNACIKESRLRMGGENTFERRWFALSPPGAQKQLWHVTFSFLVCLRGDFCVKIAHSVCCISSSSSQERFVYTRVCLLYLRLVVIRDETRNRCLNVH